MDETCSTGDGQSIKGLVINHSLHRHTLFGAMAGLAAGIVMTPFLMLITKVSRLKLLDIKWGW